MHPIPSFLPLYFCSLVTWKNAADTFSLFLKPQWFSQPLIEKSTRNMDIEIT